MIKSVLSFILIFQFAICNIALGCPESVTLLQKGTPAPCTGFLFSPDAERQAKADHDDSRYYKLLSEKMTDRHELMVKQADILDKRIQLYIEQNNTLSEQLYKQEKRSEWEKIGWFILGIGVTGVAIYGVGQLK